MTSNQISYAKLKEDQRHNRRTERQTDTSIAEGIRHNRESERLGWGNVGLGYSNLGELITHNRAIESIQQDTLGESIRHNEKEEGIKEKKNTIESIKMGSKFARSTYAYGTLATEGFKLLEPAAKDFATRRESSHINKSYVGAR